MNKRLLLLIAVGVSAVSSFAYNVGDYIFTPDAKYKVIGENLVQNGKFADNYTGWSNLTGAAVSTDFWSIEAGVGPNGENVLQCVSAADGNDGAYVFQTNPYEASKTYVISMDVMAPMAITTSTTEGAQNYLDVFVNSDFSSSKTADGFKQVAASTTLPSNEWTNVSFAFTDEVEGGSTGGIQIAFGRLVEGTQITNIEIHEVQNVFDTRILEKKLAYDKKLLAIPEFTNESDELTGLIAMLDMYLETGEDPGLGISLDDVQGMTDFMESLTEVERNFMDANSGDLVSYIDRGDWTAWGKYNNGDGVGTQGDWHFEGARWGHPSGSAECNQYIQGSYTLENGTAYVTKSLPAGKYFFQIDAMGYAMAGTGNDVRYTPDYESKLTGAYVFLGNDTVKIDTMDARNYQSYFIIGEVAEGEDLKAGIYFADGPSKLGGRRFVTKPILRVVGTDGLDKIELFIADQAKAVQDNDAKVMIDSAITVKTKAEFPMGKATLQAGIDECQADYNTLHEMISTTMLESASGDGTQVTVADSLMEVMRNMRGYIQAYYGENAPYTDLVEATDVAQMLKDDPKNAGASASTRAALTTAIDNANATIAVFEAQTDSVAGDRDKADELIAALTLASENFAATTASLSNPSDIAIVNGSFESGNADGWDTSGSQTDNGRWKFGKDERFDGNTHISMWRGNTAFSKNKVVQNVTLTHAGTYEFACQWYGFNENGSRDGDETIDSHVYYFAKVASAADSIASISLHTNRNYVDTLGYGKDTPQYFTIIYNKTDDTPTEIQFGFDGLQNGSSVGGLNTYVYGSNTVKYFGDFNNYKTDVTAALNDAVAAAQAKLDANTQLKDSVEYKALANAILAAKSAIDGTTPAYPLSYTVTAPFLQTYVSYVAADPEAGIAESYWISNNDPDSEKAALMSKALKTLARANAAFDVEATGIESITVNNGIKKAAVKGVYTLTGQKVGNSIEGLAKGIYIVNGKKILVK
jgi:hypothetical protein